MQPDIGKFMEEGQKALIARKKDDAIRAFESALEEIPADRLASIALTSSLALPSSAWALIAAFSVTVTWARASSAAHPP